MRKPHVPPPRLLFWETTAGCNLRCLHCRRLDVADAVTPDDLSTVEALQILTDIASYAKPILVFSGGEPLLRKDIFYLAETARDLGFRTALATNGVLVTEEIAKGIRDVGVSRVSVSLDGSEPASHDRLRGPGNFGLALAGLQRLKAAGVGTQINMTVTRRNANELPALYQRCLAMGVDALHLFMLVPVGCGVRLADTDVLPPDEYEHWLKWFCDREFENKIELKATCAPHYFRVVRQMSKEKGGLPPSHDRQQSKGSTPQSLHQTTRGCLAGSGVCFLSHTGEVFPCGYLPLNAGDLRRESFRKVWEESPVFERLRNPDFLEGKCGVCSFNAVCGGCRARAYHAHGSELAEEPCCAYDPPKTHDA